MSSLLERRDELYSEISTGKNTHTHESLQHYNTSSESPNIFLGGNIETNDVHHVHHVHPLDLSKAIDSSSEAKDNAKKVIDQALIDCANNPSTFTSDAFSEACNLISKDKSLWIEYRAKIKAEKPAGVLMADIDGMVANQLGGESRQDSVATELIKLVTTHGALFFDSKADKAFISVEIEGVLNTLVIGHKPFIDWVSYDYYKNTGKSASELAIKQASFALSGIAKFEGKEEHVFIRVADKDGGHYIFIGDDKRQVIEVLPTGWQITNKAPVKFWMSSAMQPLPVPTKGGDLDKLWDFINIPEQDRLLVLAWILESLRANTPKPILAFNGTQGSAKSSTQDKIRQLIDNNSVNLRAAPKTVEDVFVSAGCGWLVSYENLSHVTPAIQDAFCTLATGGGFATRRFHTNSEENIIDVKRPIVCNSIPSVLTAQDVTDRAITLELPSITYREESQINAEWDKAKPAIFGGLLDLFVKTLAKMPSVELNNPPRMADFTRLGEAMAQALGHSSGKFAELYKANRSDGISRSLEASPIAVAVRDMVEEYNGLSSPVFEGTMKALLEKLDKYKQEAHAWPKTPRGLGDALRRQQPALKSLGILIEISKPKKDGVHIKITKKGEHGEHGEHGSNNNMYQKNITTDLSSVAFSSDAAQPVKKMTVTCGQCLHFKSLHPHGKGGGKCLGEGRYGAWSDTKHNCDKFEVKA